MLAALREARLPVAERPEDSVDVDDNTVWNVKPDASCGWELTTPILQGLPGLVEVMDACRTLGHVATSLGLIVNARTGTHVHLGWSLGCLA